MWYYYYYYIKEETWVDKIKKYATFSNLLHFLIIGFLAFIYYSLVYYFYWNHYENFDIGCLKEIIYCLQYATPFALWYFYKTYNDCKAIFLSAIFLLGIHPFFGALTWISFLIYWTANILWKTMEKYISIKRKETVIN